MRINNLNPLGGRKLVEEVVVLQVVEVETAITPSEGENIMRGSTLMSRVIVCINIHDPLGDGNKK